MKTVKAIRAARDEAVTEKTAALEKAQVDEEQARHSDEQVKSARLSCKSLKKDLRLTRHNLQLIEADVISARSAGFQKGFETVNRVMQVRFPEAFLSDLQWANYRQVSEVGTPVTKERDAAGLVEALEEEGPALEATPAGQ